jgi:hypothetical protein
MCDYFCVFSVWNKYREDQWAGMPSTSQLISEPSFFFHIDVACVKFVERKFKFLLRRHILQLLINNLIQFVGLPHWGTNSLRVFENRMLKETSGPKRNEGSGEDYINWSFMICSPDQTIFGRSNQEERDGRGMWHVCGRGEVHTGFWWGNLREREYFKDLSVDGRIS